MKKENRFKNIVNCLKTGIIGEVLSNKTQEIPSEFSSKSIILYYRYYSNFKVYASVLEGKLNLMDDDSLYYDLDEIYRVYKEKYQDIECFNVLSEDYVYLTKSGVYTRGDDLRDSNSRLCDDVFFILYATDCLDRVLYVTNKFNCKSYGFVDRLYNAVNKNKWSMSLVDEGLAENNRLSVLLYPIGNSIEYDFLTDRVFTNPVELYSDLFIYCEKKNLFLHHCGDLGLQVSMK